MSDNEDSVVHFEDILQSIDEEKAIIMGGLDNRICCTFMKGYMKRQAVYTCITCLDVETVRGGFCYPCLLNCHAGHETLELYTKRRFRCDCGNAKFGDVQCNLWEEKDDENAENKYNDNFVNRYCTCKRPYPDEEYEGDEEMLQCSLCEDWYHIEHLNLPADKGKPTDTDYKELACFLCMEKYPLLCLYAITNGEYPLDATKIEEPELLKDLYCSNENGDVSETDKKRPKLDIPSKDTQSMTNSNNKCQLIRNAISYGCSTKDFRTIGWKELNLVKTEHMCSVFWSPGWRERLCRCSNCLMLYKQFDLSFLLDPQDTMDFYLKAGEEKADELDQEETKAFSEALSELPRPLAITVAQGINRFKTALEDFLKEKRDSDHIVTADEVRSFFGKLREQQQ